MESIEDMERRLAAQEAWGKWNTAPLANRIAEAKRAQMTPARRALDDVMGGAFDALMIVLGWAMWLVPLWMTVSSWLG